MSAEPKIYSLTAEFARECDERRQKIYDLVELLTASDERSVQLREVAQVGVFSRLEQGGYNQQTGARMERERAQSETTEAVHRIKEEIDKLTEQQSEAIKTATYVGMTTDEAKEYDERRDRILKLVRDLATLEESQ